MDRENLSRVVFLLVGLSGFVGLVYLMPPEPVEYHEMEIYQGVVVSEPLKCNECINLSFAEVKLSNGETHISVWKTDSLPVMRGKKVKVVLSTKSEGIEGKPVYIFLVVQVEGGGGASLHPIFI